mmetsp:Transcript_20398/g.52262  ORF Transcript_20398/g.52262 Transcript_20398/m.52262 type:complete len:177 (+) Transcript_20398:1605-2135(+)
MCSSFSFRFAELSMSGNLGKAEIYAHMYWCKEKEKKRRNIRIEEKENRKQKIEKEASVLLPSLSFIIQITNVERTIERNMTDHCPPHTHTCHTQTKSDQLCIRYRCVNVSNRFPTRRWRAMHSTGKVSTKNVYHSSRNVPVPSFPLFQSKRSWISSSVEGGNEKRKEGFFVIYPSV